MYYNFGFIVLILVIVYVIVDAVHKKSIRDKKTEAKKIEKMEMIKK